MDQPGKTSVGMGRGAVRQAFLRVANRVFGSDVEVTAVPTRARNRVLKVVSKSTGAAIGYVKLFGDVEKYRVELWALFHPSLRYLAPSVIAHGLDTGEHHSVSLPWIAMTSLDGITLETWLNGSWSRRDLHSAGSRLGQALATVHTIRTSTFGRGFVRDAPFVSGETVLSCLLETDARAIWPWIDTLEQTTWSHAVERLERSIFGNVGKDSFLCRQDISVGNVLLAGAGAILLIDFEHAVGMVPELDLADADFRLGARWPLLVEGIHQGYEEWTGREYRDYVLTDWLLFVSVRAFAYGVKTGDKDYRRRSWETFSSLLKQ